MVYVVSCLASFFRLLSLTHTGIAVFSVSLTTSEGELVPPGQCEIAPREGGWDPAILQRTHSVCAQGTEAVLEGVEEIPESGWDQALVPV